MNDELHERAMLVMLPIVFILNKEPILTMNEMVRRAYVVADAVVEEKRQRLKRTEETTRPASWETK